ncbi:hypothetical protein PV416_31550 [Streptomyces ipomoeae]|nr:hypothetical protein [Streptomyces ipomoeae]MDX2696871.1 hypothetical protein [Streptomyces ipomoeae]MDX2825491.1 hypothetical protein [Streptomyces ipomoeae]
MARARLPRRHAARALAEPGRGPGAGSAGARTGTDIDAATLRARLGIPDDLAGALVAQLA